MWVPSGVGSEDLLSVVTDLRQKRVIRDFLTVIRNCLNVIRNCLTDGFGTETPPELGEIIGVASLDLGAQPNEDTGLDSQECSPMPAG